MPGPDVRQGTGGRDNLVARALVRILGRSAEPVGFGLMVAVGRVVTCAHVVALSLGEEPSLAAAPGERVLLDFPFLAPGRILTAEVAAWQPRADDGSGDVVGLVLDTKVPAEASPLALARGGSVSGHEFVAYGYRGGDVPTWVPGRIIDRTERGLLQLGLGELTGGLRIRQGFSGTPVWDEQSGQVVGLVSAGSIGRSEWLAYAVSGETIFDAWPDLRESFMQACPFRSLVPFTSADSEVFFGRDELAAEAAGQIARSEHTIIAGASGAGKTSLLNAKVIPELQRQGHAVIAIPSEGNDSLWATIARALAVKAHSSFGSDQLSTRTQLAAAFAAESLQSKVARLCDALGSDRVIVVVDQYELLLLDGQPRAGEFTWDLGQLPSVRHPEGRPRVRVVIALREDHESGLRAMPPYDTCAASVVHVGPLTIDQLRAAIEEPVLRSGFARYEGTLVDRIIDEVHVQPYSLPALQVILTELWDRMDPDGLLRHSVYQELNQGPGPLATHLQRRWDELGQAGHAAARRLFLHLVVPVGDNGFARRTASQEEMSAEDWQIAGALATLRLIVLRAPVGTPTAELVHDALIDQWPALARHLAAYRDFLQWRDDTRRRIAAWQQSGRQPSQLLSGSALNRGIAQQGARAAGLSQPEHEFVNLSKSRRARLRRRTFMSVTIVLAVIATLVTFAVVQRHVANQNAKVALSRQLAATAGQLAHGDPQLAALLSVAAYKISDTSEAQSSLAQQLRNLRFIDRFLNVGSSAGIAFARDGRTIIVCGTEVSIWNVKRGTRIAKLPNSACSRMALSPDGHSLAIENVSRAPSHVSLWDMRTMRRFATFPAGYGPLAFSPNGQVLAIGGSGFTKIALWNIVKRTRIAFLAVPRPPGQTAPEANGNFALAFSPDGRLLAADSTLVPRPPATGLVTVVWNLQTRKIVARLAGGHTRGIFCLAFSPNGRMLASGGHDAKIVLWNLPDHGRRTVLQADGDVNGLAFSPDGRTLVSGDSGGHVIVWNIARHVRRATLTAHTAAVSSIAFSRDGHTFASGGGDSKVAIWDLSGTNHIVTAALSGATGPVMFSPDGRIMAAYTTRGVGLWNTAHRIQLALLPIRASILGFSEGGRTLVLVDAHGNLISWDIAQHSEITTPLPAALTRQGGTSIAALSPDGTTVAYESKSGDNGEVTLWDIRHSHVQAILHPGNLAGLTYASLAFSVDGRTLAVGGVGSVTFLDLGQRTQIASLAERDLGASVPAVAFSPDGRTFASTALRSGETTLGCAECYVIVRDLSHNTPIATLAGYTYQPDGLAFSPDGSILATASAGEVILWSVPQRAKLLAPKAAGPVAFSPNGKIVATSTTWRLGIGPAGITLWNVDPSSWATQLCLIAGRNLTRAEWATYLSRNPYQQICRI